MNCFQMNLLEDLILTYIWRELFLFQAESGGSGVVARRLTGQAGSDEFVMKIPNNKVWERRFV